MSYQPKDQKERVLHRLKIAQGHLKKVISMLETDTYCVDVIHQSQAVQKALKEVDNLLLENHLKGCVSNAIKQGEDKQAIEEVMTVFKRSVH